MRPLFSSALAIALLTISSIANAEEDVPFKLGMSFDVSVPSGAALGVEARLPQ